MLGLADHQLDAVAAGRLDHVVALCKREGHGLLDEHVLASVERVDREAVVELVAEGDGDGIDFVVLEQLGVVGIGAGDLVAIAELAAGRFKEIGSGDDFDVWERLDGVAVRPGNSAESDDSDAEHADFLPAIRDAPRTRWPARRPWCSRRGHLLYPPVSPRPRDCDGPISARPGHEEEIRDAACWSDTLRHRRLAARF